MLLSSMTAKTTVRQVQSFFFFFFFFFFFWQCRGLVIRPRLGGPFATQNPRKLCAHHYPGRILGCASTTYISVQISISCTIPSESPSPPSRVCSCNLFALIYCICLLYDCSFLLYDLVIYIYYFVASYYYDDNESFSAFLTGGFSLKSEWL